MGRSVGLTTRVRVSAGYLQLGCHVVLHVADVQYLGLHSYHVMQHHHINTQLGRSHVTLPQPPPIIPHLGSSVLPVGSITGAWTEAAASDTSSAASQHRLP
jgi:hypothetical protein